MTDSLLEGFHLHLKSLKPESRKRFVHGVYKQVALSHKGKQAHGEYSALFKYAREDEWRVWFFLHFTDELFRYGFFPHAPRLLKQQGLEETYDRWKKTLTVLEEIEPGWKEYLEFHPGWRGIHLVTRGREENNFSTSIVLHGSSYGREGGLYEVSPIFEGRGLKQRGYADDVIGSVTLEDALALARATLSRDAAQFESAVEQIFEGERAESLARISALA